jgi:uncharacterized protein DUF1629
MKYDFVIWLYSNAVKNAMTVRKVENVEQVFELRDGVSRAADFPADATYEADPNRPHNTILTDNLFNINGFIVASSRLRRLLEGRAVPKVEYLPVIVRDHKGKVASCDYSIVHPIDPVDCIDLQQSKVKWDKIVPSDIERISRLVIDESRIPADRALFRPKAYSEVTLVRRDLAEDISRNEMTGVRWLEVNKYPEK